MKIAIVQTADIGLLNDLFLFKNKVYTKDIFRNKGE
ncbi:hypothetical protein SDC9_36855 [bioreactor metagenome]|uniref:Uncharacterized protein n=1 Tax=bioreactor metagenome TaxID=1076179 RepID=A0A644VHD1_9ZZZZ